MGTINEALKYLKEDIDKLSNEEVEFLNNVIEDEGLESYLAETPFEIYDDDPRFIVFNAKDEHSNFSLADLLLTAGMYKRFHVYSGFNNVNLLKRKEIKKAYDIAKDEEKDIDLTYIVTYGDKVKDYLKNVEKVANDLIDLKVTDFIFDEKSFKDYDVDIFGFYNDLVDELRNRGYGLSSIIIDHSKDKVGEIDLFNYKYTISPLNEALSKKETEEEEKRRLSQEIGLQNTDDLRKFRKYIKEPFESDLDALRRYRKELGDHFKIKENFIERDKDKNSDLNQIKTKEVVADTIDIGDELILTNDKGESFKWFVKDVIQRDPQSAYLTVVLENESGNKKRLYLNINDRVKIKENLNEDKDSISDVENEFINEDYIAYETADDLERVFRAYLNSDIRSQKEELAKAVSIALYQTYNNEDIDRDRWEEIKEEIDTFRLTNK